jgi:signal peptidase I
METPRESPDRAVGGTGWAVILAVSLARSYLILLSTLGAAVVIPGLLGWAASVVQSESMAPNVSTGDVVLTTPLPESSPLPIGGVVTFRVDDRTIVHRIVSVNEDNSMVTAGDANPQLDPWTISREDITGQARLLVPYVGLPSLWMQRGQLVPLTGWLLLTIAAVALAIPATTARRVPRHRDNAETPLPVTPLAAAGVAGILAVAVVAIPLAQVEAAFTDTARSSSSWTTKSYAAITVGAMAEHGAIAATSITDTSNTSYNSTIVGDAATTPGASVAGFRDSDIDTVHLNNQAAKAAMAAAQSARAALNERAVTSVLPAALSGTLGGGVYTSTTGAFSIAGTLTLDAKGDTSARFVFRTTSALTMAQRARVVLANGANAANVYWVVGTTATIGTVSSGTPDTTTVGTYFVAGSVALRGVNLSGRAISFGGSIALNGRIAPVN